MLEKSTKRQFLTPSREPLVPDPKPYRLLRVHLYSFDSGSAAGVDLGDRPPY
jgi:hypothetical protein